MMATSSDTDQFIARAAGFAAFSIPALLGLLAASHEPYWLDSPEFTAAAQTLGMPHPPGHPLYVMLTKPFTLIPLGGVAFRVSLASTIFGALASFILFQLVFRVIKGLADTLETWIVSTVSLSTAILASVAPGRWFQCVRQEVYALQILLVLAALLPLVSFCLDRSPRPDERRLYLAAFFAGLEFSCRDTAIAGPIVKEIADRLMFLDDVGLDYLTLDRPAGTLAGGEAQRIKLAEELAKPSRGRTFYVLDEPTTGLHLADVTRLVDVLQALVDQGNTVAVIEHNLELIKEADYVLDLGPEGGEGGGRIVTAGSPIEILARPNGSHTARHLEKYLGA